MIATLCYLLRNTNPFSMMQFKQARLVKKVLLCDFPRITTHLLHYVVFHRLVVYLCKSWSFLRYFRHVSSKNDKSFLN